MKVVKAILFVLLLNLSAKAQDVQFSQFYSSAIFVNPAFAGSALFPRASTIQRMQWPKLSSKYVSSLVAVDGYLPNIKSGVGGYIFYDAQGQNSVSTVEIAGQYSYEVPLNEDLELRLGLQASYNSRYVDYSRLVFDYQYNYDGTDNGLGNGLAGKPRRNYLDFATGLVLHSDAFWFGASWYHLSTPSLNILTADNSPLPMRFSFITGYRISLYKEKKGTNYGGFDHDRAIIPTFHYKFQGKSDQFDLGIYGVYEHFITGLWYRGLPVKKFEDFQNNESFVLMVGIRQLKAFEIRYSYDFTISTLAAARSGGAHEISASVLIRKYGGHKIQKRIPCPSHSPTKLWKKQNEGGFF